MGRIGTPCRLAATAVVATAVAAGYPAWRPRMLRWGATDAEATETLPGDEATPHPRVQQHAGHRHRRPARPGLAVAGPDGHRARRFLHPRLARTPALPRPLRRGPPLGHPHPPRAPGPEARRPHLHGGGAYTPVTEAEPFRHLVTFETFVLRPLPGDRTRLIARTRGTGYLQQALHAVAPDTGPSPRLIASVVRNRPGADLPRSRVRRHRRRTDEAGVFQRQGAAEPRSWPGERFSLSR